MGEVKSENDTALKPSVEVNGPPVAVTFERQTLIFIFRKLLQLSESKLQTSNQLTVKLFLLTMCSSTPGKFRQKARVWIGISQSVV